jgi:hypothetical protein
MDWDNYAERLERWYHSKKMRDVNGNVFDPPNLRYLPNSPDNYWNVG